MGRPRRLCKDCGTALGRNAWSRGVERCLPCSAKARTMPRPSCPDCGKTLSRTALWSGTKRCAVCANIAKRGTPLSEEHRRKIGQAGTGRRWSEEFRARFIRLRTGHPVSAETRAKIAAGHKGKPLSEEHRRKLRAYRHTAEELEKMRGSNHWAYRDGRGNLPYPQGWSAIRQSIRERDECLCQHPGCYIPENGRRHDCHHIDRDKKNNRADNLILLCFKHHAATKRGNVGYWTEYYQAIQAARGLSWPT